MEEILERILNILLGNKVTKLILIFWLIYETLNYIFHKIYPYLINRYNNNKSPFLKLICNNKIIKFCKLKLHNKLKCLLVLVRIPIIPFCSFVLTILSNNYLINDKEKDIITLLLKTSEHFSIRMQACILVTDLFISSVFFTLLLIYLTLFLFKDNKIINQFYMKDFFPYPFWMSCISSITIITCMTTCIFINKQYLKYLLLTEMCIIFVLCILIYIMIKKRTLSINDFKLWCSNISCLMEFLI